MRFFIRLALTPSFLIYSALAVTSRWWITAATYLFLRSFLVAPNGFWAWLAIVAFGSFMIIGTWVVFVKRWRKALPLRLLRKATWKLAGNSNVFDLRIGTGIPKGGVSSVRHELLKAVEHHVPSFLYGLTL